MKIIFSKIIFLNLYNTLLKKTRAVEGLTHFFPFLEVFCCQLLNLLTELFPHNLPNFLRFQQGGKSSPNCYFMAENQIVFHDNFEMK